MKIGDRSSTTRASTAPAKAMINRIDIYIGAWPERKKERKRERDNKRERGPKRKRERKLKIALHFV